MRLIPAHAGSTRVRTTSSTGRRAHPRSRGEHSMIRLPAQSGYGSSPLTRGARRLVFGEDSPDRLIPAHAGSTLAPSGWG